MPATRQKSRPRKTAIPPPIIETVTVAEVAIGLRLSEATVRRLIREGKLKAARVGRAFRIVRASLDNFLNGN